MKQYAINEIYRTVHGEGVRYGVAHIFVRFARCNLSCGFCDTEFDSGRNLTASEILTECDRLSANEPAPPLAIVEGALNHPDNGPPATPIRNVLFCGGEPLLQLDDAIVSAFK